MPEVRFGGKDGTTVQSRDDVAPPECERIHVRVGVDIAHSWTGDLVVTLDPTAAMGVASITLHDRAGGSGHGLRRSYDVNSVPALAGCRGHSAEGAWTLIVEDKAADDVGRIRGLTLEFTLSSAERAAEPTRSRRSRVAVAG